jgi:predicted acetyltransferase
MPPPDSSAARLVLRPFTLGDEREAAAAQEELKADGFEFLLDVTDGQSWPDYLARLDQISRGVNVAADRVPADLLAADVDGELVGRVSIRHTIDHPFLSEYGGHIGYATRPGYRKRGYARAMLRLSLQRARELGFESALLTCDDDNAGSAATIESCGGVFERITMLNDSPRRRYWVPTS